MNFLYAVQEKQYPAVNIGHSSQTPPDVQARLQQGNPRKLSKITVIREYPTKAKAKAAEDFVHKALGGKGRGGPLSIRGEWYKPKALDMLDGILDDYEKP